MTSQEAHTDVYCDSETGDDCDCTSDARFSGVCDDKDVTIPVFVNNKRTSLLRPSETRAAAQRLLWTNI